MNSGLPSWLRPPLNGDSELSVAIITSLGKLQERGEDQERAANNQAILDWITLLDFGPQHSDFINLRQAGTGKWLLESPEFTNWVDNGKTLYCPGMLGAGKTILSAAVAEELTHRVQDDERVRVVYIYCNFRRQHEQGAGDLMSSLLKQLIQPLYSMPECIHTLYKRHAGPGTRISFGETVACLKSIIADAYSKVYFVIDALDECQVSGNGRMKFLTALMRLQAECQSTISVFATSRFSPEIGEVFTDAAQLEVSAAPEDVRAYLAGRIPELASCVRRSAELQVEIREKITDAVEGM